MFRLFTIFLLLFLSLTSLFVFGVHANENFGGDGFVFAVVGDFGMGNSDETAVANLIKNIMNNVTLILTCGDNNYPEGEQQTLDQHVGKDFAHFIYPYSGAFPSPNAVTENAFFPSPGNHDWMPGNLAAYADYFRGAYSLNSPNYYYHFRHKNVDFFSIDSGVSDSSGDNRSSVQAMWLYEQLDIRRQDQTWKIVFFHYPPYSSSWHGSIPSMRWDFEQHGVHVVFSGHDHSYERLQSPGSSLVYFVNGLGGARFYDFPPENAVSFSRFKFNSAHGAQRVIANESHLVIDFMDVNGVVIDRHVCQNMSCIDSQNANANAQNNDSNDAFSVGTALLSLFLFISSLIGVIYLVHACYRMRVNRQRESQLRLQQQQQQHQQGQAQGQRQAEQGHLQETEMQASDDAGRSRLLHSHNHVVDSDEPYLYDDVAL